jgi:hypothetical protein
MRSTALWTMALHGIQSRAISRPKRRAFEKVMQISSGNPWLTGTLIATLALLSSCGKADHAAAPGSAHASRTAATKGSGGSALDLADMVRAVSSGKVATEIDLKFALRERPVVGEPVDIDLALIPAHELDQVYATFSAADGLEITKGGRTSQIQHPEPGAPITHLVTIVPQRDGIFFVNATVLTDSPTNSTTHSFSIPIIAGAGIAASVAPGSDLPAAPAAHPQGGSR